MFCRHCGNELPDDAQFCNACGKSVDTRQQESELLQEPPQEKSSDPEIGAVVDTVKRPVRKNGLKKAVIIAIIVLGVVALGSLGLRAVNESSMKQQVPQNIFEGSQEDIVAHYDTVMPYPYGSGLGYTYDCDFTTFKITKGDQSNTFHVTGELEVMDMSQGTRPTYGIDITGTIVTNFFRSDYSLEWKMSFQDPPAGTDNSLDRPITTADGDIISIKVLNDAYEYNSVSATNTYANQYLNIEGVIYDIITEYDGTVTITMGYKRANDFVTDDILPCARFSFDPSDPNLVDLGKGESVILRGYLESETGMFGFPQFSNATVYGGDYSDDSSYPNTTDDYSNSPEYDEYGNLTDNSPNLPINLSEPFGYYEKADDEGGFSIEYISDDDSVRIEYYSDGQPGYYGGQWFEADFHMSCDYIDFSSDNVLDFVDNDGNSVIRFDAYESYITVTASEPLYGVPVDRINGNYYCKVQSTLLQ